MKTDYIPTDDEVRDAVNTLITACHGAAVRSGWHRDRRSNLPRTAEQHDEAYPRYCMLAVSEIAEAMEGHRTSAMDDKLTHRPQMEVEWADLLIRAADTAGVMDAHFGMDVASAVVEKLAFNSIRKDHSPEERAKSGGKKY